MAGVLAAARGGQQVPSKLPSEPPATATASAPAAARATAGAAPSRAQDDGLHMRLRQQLDQALLEVAGQDLSAQAAQGMCSGKVG